MKAKLFTEIIGNVKNHIRPFPSVNYRYLLLLMKRIIIIEYLEI
jgi:hypothetical protein